MTDMQINAEPIVATAEKLFATHGYDRVTLSAIANEANLPLASVEHTYATKPDIVLAIYHQMADSCLNKTESLPYESVATRYHMLLTYNLDQLQQHKDAVSALFAMAMQRNSHISPEAISQGNQDPFLVAMREVVQGATDKPPKEEDELAMLLYAFHFLVVIFWLYDRTEEHQATQYFVDFLGEFFRMMRPMMMMPMVKKAFNKMAKIVMLVFGGAKLAS